MTYKLFYSCFDQSHFGEVDPLMTPFDNTSNKHPELREYHIFDRIINEGAANDVDLWGMFGPRWNIKLRFGTNEIDNAIKNNPGKDVYLFNHARICNALFVNVWEQGEIYHPGIKQVVTAALKTGHYDTSSLNVLMTDATCYCSYFVATHKFWKEYMSFLKDVKIHLDSLSGEYKQMYEGSANYSRDKSLNMFPFIVERLFSTYLHTSNYNIYSHPADYTVYSNQIGHVADYVADIYELKKRISSNDDLNEWNQKRNFVLQKYSTILSCD